MKRFSSDYKQRFIYIFISKLNVYVHCNKYTTQDLSHINFRPCNIIACAKSVMILMIIKVDVAFEQACYVVVMSGMASKGIFELK